MSRALPGSTRRVAALGAAALLAIVGLTGCIKVDAVVGIAPDATASGTFAVGFQKEAAGFLGIADLESFEREISSGALDEGGDLEAFKDCVTSETDVSYVYTCTFANEPFTNPDDLWQIAKEGDEIVFTMQNEGSDPESAEMLGGADLGSLRVDVQFPGPITSIQGEFAEQVSDTEAKVSASASDAFDVTIRSESGGGGASIAVILVILVAVVVAIVLVIAVVLLAMRRRAGTAPVPVEPVAATDAAATEPAAAAEPVDLAKPTEQPLEPEQSQEPDQPGTTPPA